LKAVFDSFLNRQWQFLPSRAGERPMKALILTPQLGLFPNHQIHYYLLLLEHIIADFPSLKRPEKAQFFARPLFLYRPYAPDPLSWKRQPGRKPNARGAAMFCQYATRVCVQIFQHSPQIGAVSAYSPCRASAGTTLSHRLQAVVQGPRGLLAGAGFSRASRPKDSSEDTSPSLGNGALSPHFRRPSASSHDVQAPAERAVADDEHGVRAGDAIRQISGDSTNSDKGIYLNERR